MGLLASHIGWDVIVTSLSLLFRMIAKWQVSAKTKALWVRVVPARPFHALHLH